MYLCADKFSSVFIKMMNLEELDYTTGIPAAFEDAQELNEMIFKLLANIIILISNYILSKLLVFRKKS